MTTVLSRSFRYGTPVLVLLALLGIVPWWVVLVPVIPMWYSAVMGVQESVERRRIIRVPMKRRVGLEEASAERKFLYADAALQQAEVERAEALLALAAARAKGKAESLAPGWRQRGRALLERTRRWGGPPAIR